MKEEQPATDYLDVVARELGVRVDRPTDGPITLQSVVDSVRGPRADLAGKIEELASARGDVRRLQDDLAKMIGERAERDEADRDAMWERDTRSE